MVHTCRVCQGQLLCKVYVPSHVPSYHRCIESTLPKMLTKSMQVKGTRSWCMLVE